MIVLGHRGGRGEGWPAENSLEAFARALAEGADGVELDVRLCATGEPVVVHDASFERATGGADRRPVHAVPRRDLPKLTGGLDVPDLASVLDLCRGRIVNVELKADVPSRRELVLAVARVLRRARAVELVASSFDPRVVLGLAAAATSVPRGMLVGARTAPLATALPLSLRPILAAAHLEDRAITASRARFLQRSGLRVVAWTVNDAARARALRAMGVRWVITDRPGSLVGALRG